MKIFNTQKSELKTSIKKTFSHKKTRFISAVAVILIAALVILLIQNAKDVSLSYTNTVIGGTLTFPESWQGKYITTPVSELDTETFIEVFDKANNEKYREQDSSFGWLFSIMKLENMRFDEFWSNYKDIGGAQPIAKDDKYIYLMLFPTDVRCDAADENLQQEYRRLESSINEVTADFISENKLTVYDFIAYEQKYVLPFVNSGTAFKNWSNAEQNEAEVFLEIYKYASLHDTEIEPLQFARDNGIDYAVPRDIVESTVRKYFDVSKEYLRTMYRYDSELQCYVDQYNNSGPNPIPVILSYTENDDSIVIKFENRWSDDNFEGGIYEVGIKKTSDGFNYAYSTVLSGAALKVSRGNDCVKAVAWSADEYLNDEEITVAGVRMGMSYEEAIDILGGLGECDEAYANSPTVKSVIKDGCHFGFYQIDESFVYQSDLKIDGVYRLLDVSLNTASQYEFPRGIRIGDSIEDVLAKFPGNDKKLRKWAYQNIYGKDEIAYPRAFLRFDMFDQCYRFVATTTKQCLSIKFDRENRVSAIDIEKADS